MQKNARMMCSFEKSACPTLKKAVHCGGTNENTFWYILNGCVYYKNFNRFDFQVPSPQECSKQFYDK